MPTVLLATDADWILDEVDAALADETTSVYRVRHGLDVLEAIDRVAPDLVILDEQIGNMGGLATLSAIRNAEGIDRIPITAVLVLLDRAHDAFLARRHDADGFLAAELGRREPLRHPPFSTLVRIVCSSPRPGAAHGAASDVGGRLGAAGVAALGPAPRPLDWGP